MGKGEVIGLVNLRPRGEPGPNGRRDHQSLAEEQRVLDEHRAQNDCQEEHVGLPLEPPLISRHGQLLAHRLRRPQIVAPVKREEDGQQGPHSHGPHGPAMFGHPPERHALEIAQEQWRIADRRQAPPHIGDNEDEEHDVVGGEAVLVHPQPGSDEQHRRSRGAEHVRNDRADEQEHCIFERCGLALDVDVDATRHHEERADERDEADVLVRRVEHFGRGVQAKQVIGQRDRAQTQRHLGVVADPPLRKKQRAQRNRA